MLAKDAFDGVCNLVFEKLENDGWKYSKSKHWITKKDKNFIYEIRFYSSFRNISDVSVDFYGEFRITSIQTKNIYLSLGTADFRIPEGKVQWNVAKEESWSRTVEEFVNWFDNICIPIVNKCSNDLENYVFEVVSEGFCSKLGYLIDIDFVLNYGSRELAEKATINYHHSLKDEVKKWFKANYESMIIGNEAVSDYGINFMRNYSNFKTIIENKIIVSL